MSRGDRVPNLDSHECARSFGYLAWAWYGGAWRPREEPAPSNLVVEVHEPGGVRLELFATGKLDCVSQNPISRLPVM